MYDRIGNPQFSGFLWRVISVLILMKLCGGMAEDEMVGCQVQGALDGIAPADELDVVYLDIVSGQPSR